MKKISRIAASACCLGYIILGAGCGNNNGDSGTVTDADGNVYQTIVIGNQEWMVGNLKVTHYRNGDVIPQVTDNSAWTSATAGAYCMYDNSTAQAADYGYLYNWHAVTDARNIAPEGWHVPTSADWEELYETLDGDNTNNDGGKLKETGTGHWLSPNTGATDETGFKALPGGRRIGNLGAAFDGIGEEGRWWSITPGNTTMAHYVYLRFNLSGFYTTSTTLKTEGCAVRCVKD